MVFDWRNCVSVWMNNHQRILTCIGDHSRLHARAILVQHLGFILDQSEFFTVRFQYKLFNSLFLCLFEVEEPVTFSFLMWCDPMNFLHVWWTQAAMWYQICLVKDYGCVRLTMLCSSVGDHQCSWWTFTHHCQGTLKMRVAGYLKL